MSLNTVIQQLNCRQLFLFLIGYLVFLGADIQYAKAQTTKAKTKPSVRHYELTFSNRVGDTKDTVYYSKQHLLTWNNFTGIPRIESAYSAAAFTGFGYLGAVNYKGDTTQINIVLDVYFIKPYSWVMDDARTDYTLKHEQLHFDITYLITERFKKRMKEVELDSDYDSILQYQYLQSYRDMNRLQERYDNETRHGTIVSEQMRWQQLVKNWLEEFDKK